MRLNATLDFGRTCSKQPLQSAFERPIPESWHDLSNGLQDEPKGPVQLLVEFLLLWLSSVICSLAVKVAAFSSLGTLMFHVFRSSINTLLRAAYN